jgi:hypothetical protein
MKEYEDMEKWSAILTVTLNMSGQVHALAVLFPLAGQNPV